MRQYRTEERQKKDEFTRDSMGQKKDRRKTSSHDRGWKNEKSIASNTANSQSSRENNQRGQPTVSQG